MNRLLIHNIGLLATPTGSAAKAGPAQGQILLQNNAWILAEDGLIKQTGTGDSWQQIPQEDLIAIPLDLVGVDHQLVQKARAAALPSTLSNVKMRAKPLMSSPISVRISG